MTLEAPDWLALQRSIEGDVVLAESPGYEGVRKPAIARFHDVRPRCCAGPLRTSPRRSHSLAAVGFRRPPAAEGTARRWRRQLRCSHVPYLQRHSRTELHSIPPALATHSGGRAHRCLAGLGSHRPRRTRSQSADRRLWRCRPAARSQPVRGQARHRIRHRRAARRTDRPGGADPTSAFHKQMSYRDIKRYLVALGDAMPGDDDQFGETLQDESSEQGHPYSKSEFFGRLPTEAIAALVENLQKGRVAGQARELDFTP
jgi:hypothetical protein